MNFDAACVLLTCPSVARVPVFALRRRGLRPNRPRGSRLGQLHVRAVTIRQTQRLIKFPPRCRNIRKNMSPTLLKLNQIAQGLLPWSSGVSWFTGLSSSDKSVVLRDLARIANQAHPRAEEVEPAMRLAGLKRTFTPCVLVSKGPSPEKTFHKILSLPETEWEKSFQLLLALLSIADARRRTARCAQGCSHEWHQLLKPA